jgi:hypothetical protein
MLGWGSLETVQSVHSWLEGGALFFFTVLVLFEALALRRTHNEKRLEKIALACLAMAIFLEVVAYPFSRRNDELATVRIAELNSRASENEKKSCPPRLRRDSVTQGISSAYVYRIYICWAST